MSNQLQTATITEEQVVAYLQNNPSFFHNQDELLTQLQIPHSRGTSVSLVERQVALLRERGLDCAKFAFLRFERRINQHQTATLPWRK